MVNRRRFIGMLASLPLVGWTCGKIKGLAYGQGPYGKAAFAGLDLGLHDEAVIVMHEHRFNPATRACECGRTMEQIFVESGEEGVVWRWKNSPLKFKGNMWVEVGEVKNGKFKYADGQGDENA